MTERMTAAEYRRTASSEDEFRRMVQDYADTHGWLYWHAPTSQLGGRHVTATEGYAGFPDTVFARAGVVLFVEFKTTKGRLSGAQRMWLAELAGGVLPSSVKRGFSHHDGPLGVAVWTPDDWPLIEKVLGPTESLRNQRPGGQGK